MLGRLLEMAKGTLGNASQNPMQAGGLGAVLGSVLGGGGKSVKGAMTGGALAMLAFLAIPTAVLIGTAISVTVPAAAAAMPDAGPHGLSATLYAYVSAAGNNGSGFAGWDGSGRWQATALGLLMLLGRYGVMLPMLAIAGSLSAKRQAPATAGTFPTHGPLFVILLVLTVLILGALSFFPVLALGPIAEQVAAL